MGIILDTEDTDMAARQAKADTDTAGMAVTDMADTALGAVMGTAVAMAALAVLVALVLAAAVLAVILAAGLGLVTAGMAGLRVVLGAVDDAIGILPGRRFALGRDRARRRTAKPIDDQQDTGRLSAWRIARNEKRAGDRS
jgi:uncharacterized membrane protein